MADDATVGAPDDSAAVSDEPKDHNAKLKEFFQSKWFRVLFTVIVAGAAVYAFSREISEEELEGAFTNSNPWWILAAVVASVLTWVGAGIPLIAFTRVKVSVKDATLVQIASTFIDIAAPAGMGDVALHLRYLTKRGVSGAAATAVVLLIEVAQFIGSVLLLVVALLFTRMDPHIQFPLKVVLIVLGAIVACAIALALLPKIRKKLEEIIVEWWKGMKPNLKWAMKHPKAQGLALAGVILQTCASALALMFCLWAVGQSTPFPLALAVYIIASTLGSMVPTPGGIGAAEAAYTAALVLVGVPGAVALSAVILFRVLTVYAVVPIGWVGWTIMQRKHLI